MGARLEEASSRSGQASPCLHPQDDTGHSGPCPPARALGLQRASLLPALCGPSSCLSASSQQQQAACLQAELPQVLGLCVCLSVRRPAGSPLCRDTGPCCFQHDAWLIHQTLPGRGQLSVQVGRGSYCKRDRESGAGWAFVPRGHRTLRWAVSQEATQSDRLCSSLSLFYSGCCLWQLRGRS